MRARRTERTLALSAATALLFMLGAAHDLGAQAYDVDHRWLPWIGCWQPVAAEATASDALLCVRSATGGVEMIEVAGREIRYAETIRADSRPYDLTTPMCEGWRSAEFSLDGNRLFIRSELACDGDVPRPSSGVIAMVTPLEWVDVQASETNGESVNWVQRYRPAPSELVQEAGFGGLVVDRNVSARAARAAASRAVDVDDIVEATRVIDSEAVRSWIAELNEPFDLDKERLLRMADAGVPPGVIDVMVAVSYPQRFVLNRDGDVEELAAADQRPPRTVYGRRPVFLGGIYSDPFYSPYSRYGYGRYGYLYDPYYDPYYRSGVVVVTPRSDAEPEARPRVVNGRGYTNGESRSSAPAGSSLRDGSKGERSTAGSGSSSGSAGSRSGSGSSSGGRTAKPRGG